MLRIHTLAFAVLALPLAFAQPALQDPKIPDDKEVVTLPSGLKMSTLTPGDGVTAPKTGDVVKMHYTGWLTNGMVFDSSVTRKEPFYFELGRGKVIKGWDEAVATMTKGQKAKLTLPPELAYGAQAQGRIPANSTLVFEVEFIDIAWRFAPVDPTVKKMTASGLGYQVLRPGAGTTPIDGNVVSFTFAGWKASGDLLTYCEDELMRRRSSPSKGQTATVGQIPSPFFNEAIKLTPVGGAIRVEVPAGVAWPQQLPQGMKADTMVTWQIEVYGIKVLPTFSKLDPAKQKRTASGLLYEVITEGTGAKPVASDRVTVHYIGWTMDGKSFDSSYSRDQVASFALGGVIKGWTEGLQLMSVGSTYKFEIPPELAYGAEGAGGDIPPNATLVFQVELISIP